MRAAASTCPQPGVFAVLEGHPVRVEERGVEGARGHYKRVLATCQTHCDPGKAPRKVKRNTGPNQTVRLGVNEPLAYLGAWLITGPQLATRDEHAACKPRELQNACVCTFAELVVTRLF